MPDSAKNFTYDGTNGPISTTTVTRDELITAMEHMNYAEGYNIRAIDELGGTGLVSVDSLGNAFARSIAASNGLGVSNATGVSGNPTISITDPNVLRQNIYNSENNQITNSVLISIITTGAGYACPAPASGVISKKVILNDSANLLTLTGSVWENPSITSVRIPPYSEVLLFSNLSGKWFVVHPSQEEEHGDIYITSGATTTVSVQSTWYEENSTWALGAHATSDFTLGSDSRLVYGGKVPGTAHVTINLAMKPASGTSQELGLTIGWYDASTTTTIHEDEYKILRTFANSSDNGHISVTGVIEIEENDYIFPAVENTSSTNDIIASSGTMVVEFFPTLDA